jgi:hypothetical protein
MPCPECGGSVARGCEQEHVCDRERRVRYELFQLREEIEGFDGRLAEYLASPGGRFEAWDAERGRARGSGRG